MAAVKGAIVLAVLERLMLTRPSNWLEVRTSPANNARLHQSHRSCVCIAHLLTRFFFNRQEHLDYLSVQALMFKHASLGAVAQVRLMFHNTRRLTD